MNFRCDVRIWILISAIGFLSSCGVDSPFSGQLRTSLRNHNARSLELIQSQAATRTGPLRVGLITDSHQNYKDFQRVIERLNRLDLDFVIHLGDFTNISLNGEYDAFAMYITNLKHPSFVVIGNHDAIGIGKEMFRKVFGSFNESFSYRGHRFILYNSNSLEFEDHSGYNPAWLRNELATAIEPTYVFQHVNFENTTSYTNSEIAQNKNDLLSAADLRFVLNGHLHSAWVRNLSNIRCATVPRVENEQYGVLELDASGDTLVFCKGQDCDEVATGPGS